MEKTAHVLIIIHATLGGLALISGLVSVVSKKGNSSHKKSGIVFYYAMLTSVLVSLVVAIVPNHENSFLFSIGIFSSYFIIMGKRALMYKTHKVVHKLEYTLVAVLLLTGILMIGYPSIIYGKTNTVLLVFGILAIVFSIRDLFVLKHISKQANNWLILHLSRIIGGYTAAVTAFLVVNDVFPGIMEWFVPGIFGLAYTAYWLRKLKKGKNMFSLS